MRERNGRPATLADVAALANVSKQTISRVINNKSEVSEPTRRRVLAAIDQLGYHPNSLARGLVTSRTMVIGLIMPNIDQPFFPEIARGVEAAAEESGYSVFLSNSGRDPERELKAIERLRGHRVAGIISFSSRLDEATVQRAAGGVFPFVSVNRDVPGDYGTVIWPGYEAGAYLATQHLLESGRRRLLFMGLSEDSNVDTEKLCGFRRAMHEAGVPFEHARVERSMAVYGRSFTKMAHGGADMMARIFAESPEIDGLFAANDMPAIGAMRYLLSQGIAVPGQVAIVGFGGSIVASLVTPKLTTISMPLYEMGYTAFQVLLDHISGREHEPRQVEMPPELLVRESS